MPSLGGAARTIRKWFAGLSGSPAREPGEPWCGTGLAAAVALERATGARLVADAALARLPELAAAEPGGLATGLGLALGGVRTAVFLGDAELAAARPELGEAVARRAPLVLYVVGGETAWAATVESGATVLVPATVAEAVDLGVVARAFAEETLRVVVITLDGPALAGSVQEAWLPSAASLAARLGQAADTVHAGTAFESALFGHHRRRVPRWHDAGRAMRLGGDPGVSAAAARAGAEAFFGGAGRLDAVARAVAEATGRALPALSGRRLAGAELGLIAAGPAGETARAIAPRLRDAGLEVATLLVHRLAPFPARAFAEMASGCRRIAVVERQTGCASDGGPLAAAVRCALASAGERIDLATIVVPGTETRLGAADLVAACRTLAASFRPRVVLGFGGLGAGDASLERWPKRRALADALRRDHPELGDLATDGGQAAGAALELRPAGSVTLALHRGANEDGLAGDAAALLHAVAGGHLRSCVRRAPAAGRAELDLVTWSLEPLADPGEDVAAEAWAALVPALEDPPALARHATLLVGAPAPVLPAGLASRSDAGELNLVELAAAAGEPAAIARERWLGALIALLVRRGVEGVTARRLRAARERALANLAEAERAALLDALVAGFEGLVAVPATVAAPAAPAAPRALAAPPQGIAAATAAEGTLGDPRRFWDQAGLPIREGESDRLLPDAAIVVGAVPPRSAPVGAWAASRPVFDPARCSACGACWTACPHAAVEVRVLPAAALVDHAIEAAGRAGRSAEPLRRFAGKIAGRWQRELAAAGGGAAGATFAAAAAAVIESARLAEDRQRELETAAAAVAGELEALAIAAPEAAAGDLVALAIDPDRCTGCGVCVEACAPGALRDEAETADRRLSASAAARAVAALPPTPAATIERLRADERVGPLAGALLDAVAGGALAGFDGAPPGSAARLAVRQALGALAFHLGAQRGALAGGVAELGERLATEIHGALARALPDRDLAALARGLDDVEQPSAGVADVAARLADAVGAERVDVPRLRRLVDAARAVADLADRLRTGENGSGRAPLTVVVGPGAALEWARRFPDNPFGVPATVAAAAPLALARGLAAAEAERAVAEARVLRRARLELERPAEAATAGSAPLAWHELEPGERRLATPVVAIVDEAAGGTEIATALDLVGGELPVVVLAIAATPAAERPSPWRALAFAADRGVVAHATVAHGSALDAAAAAIAAADGGALLRVLAPSPDAGQPAFEVLDRARRVVEARGFPLGCRTATAALTAAALRVDPLAEADERERRHADELAAAEARHRAELERLEPELARRLAERARARLLALAARRREAS